MEGRKVEEKQQKQYNNTEWENWGRDEDRNGWREGWQASAEACSLTTVRKGA